MTNTQTLIQRNRRQAARTIDKINLDKMENRKATIDKSKTFSPFEKISTDVILDIKNLDAQKQQPIEDQVKNLTRFLLVQKQRQNKDITGQCLEEVEASVVRMYSQHFVNDESGLELRNVIQQVIRDFAPIPAPMKTSPRIHASVKSIDWGDN